MMNLKFEKLMPNDSVDISSYEEALEFAITNSMTNIALSGPYGAGKSSVIESYKKKNHNKEYMHISLSHFDGTKSIDTQILEGKIINQLLHQIKYNNIPQTIFKAKENTSKWNRMVITLIFTLTIFTGIVSFDFSRWINFINLFFAQNTQSWLSSNQFHIVCIFSFVGSSIFLLYKCITLQMNRQLLKRVMVKGNEIEIFKDSEESYFDKFMNDVIYLFINSKKDIIVFEDLDRFDDPTIYERLHEINTLVNRRLGINKKSKRIVFMYLIKDDTFKSKDRTKFFDMIIPIVPVIDSSNSFDKFLDIFEKSEVKDDFSIQFLRKISLYIDDMRLLKNINNEYLIYKNRLSMINLNKDKLLAIIVYKNLFPKDFSLFQSGVGYINQIIKEKKKIIQIKKHSLLNEIKDIENDIVVAREENMDSIDELDAIFLQLPAETYIIVDGKKESEFSNRGEFIKAIKRSNYKVLQYKTTNEYYGNIRWSSTEVDLSQEFEKIKQNKIYNEKLRTIENKKKIKRLEQTKHKLEKENEMLLNKNLSSLLKDQKNKFFENEEIFSEEFYYLFSNQYFPLIIFLLREGLIDESYNDYLTYFYENSLRKEDKEFLRGIYDKNLKETDYKLTNLELILSNLEETDISIYQIKNVDLATYIILNYPKYENYLIRTFEIMREDENNDYLLRTFKKILHKNNIEEFSKVLIKLWPTVLNDSIGKKYSSTNELEFVYRMSVLFETEVLELNNENQFISDYIAKQEIACFNDLDEEEQTQLLEKFKKINVMYDSLISTKVKLSTIKKIVKSRLFVLSEQNLRCILGLYNIEYTEREFLSSNISLFAKNDPEKLYNYLTEEEIKLYIRLYLDFGSSVLNEKSNVVVKILNAGNLELELSKKLLRKIIFFDRIDDISNVSNKEFWSILLENRNIKVNALNVFYLYQEQENIFSKELVAAINEVKERIDFSDQVEKISDKDKNLLFDSIAKNNEIVNEQYISMLNSLNLVYKEGFSLDVSDEKIRGLILSKIIKLSKLNILEAKDNHENNIVDFALIDIEAFCEFFSDEEIYDHTQLVRLLNDEKISDTERKKIIDISQKGISIENTTFSYAIQKYILQNKFTEIDLEFLVKNYASFPKVIKIEIRKIVTKNINIVIENQFAMDITLLENLLLDIQFTQRKELFSWYIRMFDTKKTLFYIERLGFPKEFISVLDRKRPKFNDTDLNKRVLSEYERRNWITKVEQNNGMLRVQGRKITS